MLFFIIQHKQKAVKIRRKHSMKHLIHSVGESSAEHGGECWEDWEDTSPSVHSWPRFPPFHLLVEYSDQFKHSSGVGLGGVRKRPSQLENGNQSQVACYTGWISKSIHHWSSLPSSDKQNICQNEYQTNWETLGIAEAGLELQPTTGSRLIIIKIETRGQLPVGAWWI